MLSPIPPVLPVPPPKADCDQKPDTWVWSALASIRGCSRRRILEALETFRAENRSDRPFVLNPHFLTFLRSAYDYSLDEQMVDRDWAWCQQMGVRIIGRWDPLYPHWLAHIPDPPVALYAQGDLSVLSMPMLSIVGSRQPTPAGEAAAFSFAKELALAGWAIVSGLALGIDGAAHRGALAAGLPQSSTVAVLGSGLARIYPTRHLSLAQDIQKKGLLLSEYPPFMPPLAAHFPDRNRIISGLSKGLLVVEAGLKSGSLITARMALEQNREVMALPGPLSNPLTQGTHRLIQEGALLVTDPSDIVRALGGGEWNRVSTVLQESTVSKQALGPDQPEEAFVWKILGFEPISLTELADRAQRSVEELLPVLMGLELEGWVKTVEGGYLRGSE